MSHRRENPYHEQNREYLESYDWSSSDIEGLDHIAKEGIGISDEKLGRITRFILDRQTEIQAQKDFDNVFYRPAQGEEGI